MRRRRRRATWFPILGFDGAFDEGVGLQTVDIRNLTVNPNGTPNVVVVPLIPDIDIPPEQSQQGGAGVIQTSLRDLVEGQTCIIERIVGTITAAVIQDNRDNLQRDGILAAGIAVVPQADDGSGNVAVSATELDPLRADNSAQPWYWRRVWVLGNQIAPTIASTGLRPTNQDMCIRTGNFIDTKGTRRAIRREERMVLILSALPTAPGEPEDLGVNFEIFTDIRVIGRMVKATNRSNFK